MNKPIPATQRKTTSAVCARTLCVLLFFAALLPGKLFAQVANQTVASGAPTTAVTFPSTRCVYNWVNSNPGIGLPASGTGDIPSFTAVNTGGSSVTATITATVAASPPAFAYIPNLIDNTVSVINMTTNTVVATIPVGGMYPRAVSASHDGSRMYVANEFGYPISVINTSTNTVIANIGLGNNPEAIVVSPDDSKLYVTSDQGVVFWVINTATNTVIAEKDEPSASTHDGISISPDGSKLYIMDDASQTVEVFSTANNQIIARIPVSSGAAPILVSPDGSRIYVSDRINNVTDVIDAATNTVVSTIKAGSIGIAISPDGSRLYIPNQPTGISVVNTTTNAVISTINTDSAPASIGVSPDGNSLYVIINSSVSVFNTANNTLITTINVGRWPGAFGNFISSATCPPIKFTITVNPGVPTITASAVTGNIAANVGSASVNPNLQQFTVAGFLLTADVTATAPPGFEVSLAANSGYTNSVTLTQSDSTLNSTVVYVRSAAADPAGSISGNVVLSSTGVTSRDVAVTGFISNSLITAATATGNIVACAGSASASPNIGQFTVAGTGLTGNITATAPTGFELSLAAGSGYGGSVTLTQSGGTVATTTVYARSSASAPVGGIFGYAAISSPGAITQNIGLTGTINAIPALTTIPNQAVNGSDTTHTVIFSGIGNTFNWVNDKPGIGLPASGTGNIASFTAINTGSSAITANITVSPSFTGTAYTLGSQANTVSAINMATHNVVATIPVGESPGALASSPDGSRVYSLSFNDGGVSAISTSTNKVIATIPLPSFSYPSNISYSADGSKVYVLTTEPEAVISVISTATNTVTATIDLGSVPNTMLLSQDGSKLFVPNANYGPNADAIFVINSATNAVVSTITTGSTNFTVAASPDGSLVYVADAGSGKVLVFNAATGASIATISIGTTPNYIAISPDGSRVYTGNTNTISVINTATNAVINTVTVGSQPGAFCFSPDGSKLYAGNWGSGSISVINTASNTVLATIAGIATGGYLFPISISPDGSQLYAAGKVLSTATNTIIATTPGGPAVFVGSPACDGTPATFTITVNRIPTTIRPGIAQGNILTCAGSASASPNIQQFTVAGVSLSANIVATAPSGFDISLSPGTGYGSSVSLTPVSGTVDSTWVYVRLSGTSATGVISGNVTLTSIGAASKTVAVTGTVNVVPTINPVANQTVINQASASVNFSGSANTFTWVNNTPGIGLTASGTGNIPAFTAMNAGNAPVTATITATPISAPYIYVINSTTNTVSVINAVTDSLITTIPVNGSPVAVAGTPDGSRIYVIAAYPNISVSVISTATNSVIATIPLPTQPASIAMSPDGSTVIVIDNDVINHTIYEINTATNTIAAAIPATLTNPGSTAVSPDLRTLYVSSDKGVVIFDTASGHITGTIPSIYGNIVISPDGSRLYAANGLSVKVVNTSTQTVTATIPISASPNISKIAISPDGKNIYLIYNSQFIAVISTATNAVTAEFWAGVPIDNLSVSADGSRIYATSYSSTTLSVISTATNAVIAHATVPAGSVGIAGNYNFDGNGCFGVPATFTITVNPSNNATLSTLIMDPHSALFPISGPGNVNYTTAVDPSVSTVTLTPTAQIANAQITINGVPVLSGATSAPIVLNSGPTTISTVVTNGTATKTYLVTVNRTGSNSGILTSLVMSPASPLIVTSSTVSVVNYTTGVDPTVTSVTFTPTVWEATQSVTVNGVPVSSGSASAPIPLNSGPTVVTIAVTAADGVSVKNYYVTVNRTGSNNANLSTLIMNPHSALILGSATPTNVSYTTSVNADISSVNLTPTPVDSLATVTVNGVAVGNGVISGPIPLSLNGPTVITTVVTAPDGTTTKTYTLTVSRTASNNATLSSIMMDPASTLLLTSSNTSTVNYTTSVAAGVGSVKLKLAPGDLGQTLTINGVMAYSNQWSAPIPLNSGPTVITVAVTADDGITVKTYYITVNRAGSSNVALSSLVLNPHSPLTLTSAVRPNITYTASVADSVTSVTVTPTLVDATATITVNGSPVLSGSASGAIALSIGANTITTVVTAQDGVTTQTYTITITRAGTGMTLTKAVDIPLDNSAASDAIVVHQGLSPNGDGIDDFLRIEGITAYPDNKLAIMDRNGLLVYEAKGYNNSNVVFDGRSNKSGTLQLPGTYFYLLNYTSGGIAKRRTGFIVLKY